MRGVMDGRKRVNQVEADDALKMQQDHVMLPKNLNLKDKQSSEMTCLLTSVAV